MQFLLQINKERSTFLAPTDEQKVSLVTRNLKPSFIKTYLLKQSRYELKNVLARFLNMCFMEGVFLDELKEAVVTSVYKKDGRINVIIIVKFRYLLAQLCKISLSR